MELVALYIQEFNGVYDSFINVNSSFSSSYSNKHLKVDSGINRTCYYDGVPATLLIGQNGSGKTTLLTFIEDFYYDNENSGFIVWYTGEQFCITGKGMLPSQVSSNKECVSLYVNSQIFNKLNVFSIKSNNTMNFNSYLFGTRRNTAKNFIDITLNNTKKRASDKKYEVDKILRYINSQRPLPDNLKGKELSIVSKFEFIKSDISKKILADPAFKSKYEFELVSYFTDLFKKYREYVVIEKNEDDIFQFLDHENLMSYCRFKRGVWGLTVFSFIFSGSPYKKKKLSLNESLFYSIISVLYSYVRKIKVQREISNLLYLKLILLTYFSSEKRIINDVEVLVKDLLPEWFRENEINRFKRDLGRDINLVADAVYYSYKYRAKILTEDGVVNYTIMNSKVATSLIELSNKIPKELDSLFSVEWNGLSSGEISLLHLLSSLDSAIENVRKRKGVKSIILLLDEIDLYLHPEWQRTILSNLLDLISDVNSDIKIQVIMSSHSPIIASDFLPVDIVTLERDKGKKIRAGTLENVGFGESIDKTMSQGFFLKSTVGDRAFALIDHLVKNRDNKDLISKYHHITSLIKNNILLHVLGIEND